MGIIDTDFTAPALHSFFNLSEDEIRHTLNDFLWGKCEIEQAAHDLTPRLRLGQTITGQLFLIPASSNQSDVMRMMRGGYYIQLLYDGFQSLSETLDLDMVLIDPHAGLSEETLFTLAMSDVVALILRPDQQDYQGTGIMLEVARKLNVPRIKLLVNEVAAVYNREDVSHKVEETYRCPVAGVLPHSEDMQALASDGLFILRHPSHLLTQAYRATTIKLFSQ